MSEPSIVVLDAAVSEEILDEAQRNVAWKLSETAAARLYFLLRELNPMMVRISADTGLTDLPDSVAQKDHHGIAASLAAGAPICLALDRRHLHSVELQTWAAEHGLRFMTPGQLLEEERARDASSERDI